MRPPLNAGENQELGCFRHTARSGFNEAPAERGGKHEDHAMRITLRPASMRPPLNAGENVPDADFDLALIKLQ